MGGRYCLIACDVRIADGHDPRCPGGDTCWEETSHSAGNVCREGESPFNAARNRRVEAMEAEYLREHDAGACEGHPFFVIDADRVLEYRCVPEVTEPRDR